MAIIIEEEKKQQSNLLSIAGWLGFLVIIALAVYYIFFVAAPVVVLPTSGSLGQLAPLANSKVKPQDVINSASFQSLRTVIPAPSPQGPTSVGRQDPFVTP